MNLNDEQKESRRQLEAGIRVGLKVESKESLIARVERIWGISISDDLTPLFFQALARVWYKPGMSCPLKDFAEDCLNRQISNEEEHMMHEGLDFEFITSAAVFHT